MKKTFFSIGMNCFIPSQDVKFIIDSTAKVSKKIIDETTQAQESENTMKIYNMVPRASKRLSLILMNNGDLYYSRLRPDTLANKYLITGQHLIKVGTGLYISVDNIKGVIGYETTVATNVRNKADETKLANLSLVRKTKKRKSTLLLKDGSVVSVALTPRKLLEDFLSEKELTGDE